MPSVCAWPQELADAERLATLKLMEKYQAFNPFKYIIYSAKIGAQTPAVEAPSRAAGVAR